MSRPRRPTAKPRASAPPAPKDKPFSLEVFPPAHLAGVLLRACALPPRRETFFWVESFFPSFNPSQRLFASAPFSLSSLSSPSPTHFSFLSSRLAIGRRSGGVRRTSRLGSDRQRWYFGGAPPLGRPSQNRRPAPQQGGLTEWVGSLWVRSLCSEKVRPLSAGAPRGVGGSPSLPVSFHGSGAGSLLLSFITLFKGFH